METVMTMLIVGLFSLWVFSLKQEIVDLQKHAGHPAKATAPGLDPDHVPARIVSNNIPLWDIK
jgi:hypothetical protein